MRRITALKNRNLIGALGLTSLLVATTGCETKSFLDPSEVGRYEKTPLLVPILDEVVVGIEQKDIYYANAREVTPADLISDNRDATIGPNDLIQVVINDLVAPGYQSVEQKRVTQNGKINLPMVGSIEVNGLTEAEVEAKVNSEYNAKGLIVDARASVTVVEALSRTYTMSGYVGGQGVYPLRRADMRLLDVITSAGGITTDQGVEHIFVVRKLENQTSPAVTQPDEDEAPPEPGIDPLAPQGRTQANDFRARITQPEDAPTTNESADELVPSEPVEPTPLPEDRIIQIEGAPPVPEEEPLPDIDMPSDEGADAGAQTQPSIDEGPMTPDMPEFDKEFDGFEFEPLTGPTDVEVIKVPLPPLQRGELQYNIVIKPGDMIVVPPPPIGEYYMGGHVNRPGAYSLTARKITLTQAMISAGGLDQVAIPARTEIIRRVGNSQLFVRIDLDRISAGLEPDIYLKPNDQVMVGTNMGAPFLAAARNAFRLTYGFGFIYDRNYAPRNDQ